MSKTLEEIALQVAEGMPDGFLWTEGCGWEAGIIQSEAIDFARRLVAALGAQSSVGESDGDGTVWWKDMPPSGTKLYAAPYIKEGWQMVPKEPTLHEGRPYQKWYSRKIEECGDPQDMPSGGLNRSAPEYGK